MTTKKNPRRELIKSLPVTLSEEEFKTHAEELARAQIERGELKGEKKRIDKEFTGRISDQDSIVSKESRIVKDRAEIRDVKCEEEKKFDEREVWTIRKDTGECISIRSMTEQEFAQIELFEELDSEETSEV